MVQRGYEVDSRWLSGYGQVKAVDLAQSTSYCKKRSKKWRGIEDYFKTFLVEMPEEIIELILLIAA